jgi:hypothetical protein
LACEARDSGCLTKIVKERSDTTMKKETATSKSEVGGAIKEARESGRREARAELGKWLEANMLNGPYRTVYSDIFPSMIQRLKEGKSL